MVCDRCGARAIEGQRFCSECGRAFPVKATASTAAALAAPSTLPPPDMTPTGTTRLYDLAHDEPHLLEPDTPASTTTTVAPLTDITAEQPLAPITKTAEFPALPADEAVGPRYFRVGVTAWVSLLTGIVIAVGLFGTVVAVETDASEPEFAIGTWSVTDLGSNLVGAAFLALGALLVGALGSCFRRRWGAGLAGGAGLALAGWAALVIGLAEQPLQAASIAVDIPSVEQFTVTLTRDLGYWLVAVGGVLGVLVFIVSLGSSRSDGRAGLNPWVAALGAVASVVAAFGPTIPEGDATFENNWSSAGLTFDQPTLYFAGRLTQLGLLAFSGVVGLLLVRRWGLGVAIGGMTVAAWLSVSTLLSIGSAPVGPAHVNPGSDSIDLHAVTTVAMTALVGLAIVAVIAAFEQAAHER